MAMSHANCTHPRTPAGRRACRNGAQVETPATDYIGEHIRKTAANHAMKARMDREYAEIKMTGATARKLAKHAGRADALAIASTMTGAELAANGNAKTEEYILDHGTPAAKRRINAAERAEEIRANANAARAREAARGRAIGRLAGFKAKHESRMVRQDKFSGCVQAALHIDAHGGSCACGWKAKVQ